MATPSLAMIPSAYADSKVYSVLPNNGDGDFTFNRDSSATRVGQNGLIQTVGYFGNQLITNGSFATDSDWNKNAGWTISGGTANCDGTANNAIAQNFSLPTGTLRIKFDITARTQGAVNLWINKPAFTQLLSVDAVGSYEVDVVTTSGANNIYFYSASNFSGSIDNVSVQQILGDQPRLNYDISNGVVQSCPSLLLEPASTNLVTYSTPINSSPYSYSGGGVGVAPTYTANAGISPDGTSTAVKLFFDINGGTTSSDLSQFAYTGSALTGDYTSSFYLKSSDSNSYTVTLLNTNGITSEAVITPEWQRFTLYNGGGTTSTNLIRIRLRGNENTSNTASLLAWGFQLENQAYATSLIPTAGSSQTRAGETCNDAGTSSTFNSTEGVLYLDFASLNNAGNYRLISLSDGTTSNRLFIGFRLDTGYLYYFVIVAGSTQASNITTITATDFTKVAVKWKANDFALWVDGVEISSDTSGISFPADTLNTIQMNEGDGAGFEFYGKVKDLRVYNEALTDAQLQTLTTL